jgi:hypothetical protein
MLTRLISSDLTDKVAKESKDSTASDHPIHHEDHDEASSGGKAKASDHQSKVRYLTLLYFLISLFLLDCISESLSCKG